MTEDKNPFGNIYISHRVIATIAYHSCQQTYGVVGLAAKNFVQGLSQAIVKDPLLGVEVTQDADSLVLDLYLIVEYGVRIKSVASSVAENVQYAIENTTGLEVKSVNVHVNGLRVSNID